MSQDLLNSKLFQKIQSFSGHPIAYEKKHLDTARAIYLDLKREIANNKNADGKEIKNQQVYSEDRTAEIEKERIQIINGTYNLHVVGMLTNDDEVSGYFTGYQWIGNKIREAIKDPHVKDVNLIIKSPGGDAYGARRVWEDIIKLSKIKPVNATVNSYCFSGAYWVASACNTIVATNLGADFGSIGVVTQFCDSTELQRQMGYEN